MKSLHGRTTDKYFSKLKKKKRQNSQHSFSSTPSEICQDVSRWNENEGWRWSLCGLGKGFVGQLYRASERVRYWQAVVICYTTVFISRFFAGNIRAYRGLLNSGVTSETQPPSCTYPLCVLWIFVRNSCLSWLALQSLPAIRWLCSGQVSLRIAELGVKIAIFLNKNCPQSFSVTEHSRISFRCILDHASSLIPPKIARRNSAYVWKLYCSKVILTRNTVWITSNVRLFDTFLVLSEVKTSRKIATQICIEYVFQAQTKVPAAFLTSMQV